MADNNYTQEMPTPSPDIKGLYRLIGTWNVFDPSGKGGAQGTVTYELMDGGFFLIQNIELEHGDNKVKGIEIIGHEHTFGAEPSAEIKSRYYGAEGYTFDYVYELEGDTLTIWGGEKGSPAYYKGQFSEDGNSATGAWFYPGGGGYESAMTRVTS